MTARQALTAYTNGYMLIPELRKVLFSEFPSENYIDLNYSFGWLSDGTITRKTFIHSITSNLYITEQGEYNANKFAMP